MEPGAEPHNPVPQPIPGVGVGGMASVDNPILLDVATSNPIDTSQDKLVIVMVGLPARGKT